MQTVYEDEGGSSRRADPVSVIVCAERISRYLEGEYLRGFGGRGIGIQICEGVFGSHQEGVQRRGGGVDKDDRIRKIRTGRKNNGEVCSGVQESSERKQI